jgi:hypothetical protein
LTYLAATFPSGDGRCSIEFEDDGRVGYAYFVNAEGRIVGDVWLYNRCPTPEEPEWVDADADGAPFANPSAYVRCHAEFALPSSVADITVDWMFRRDGCWARVFIGQKLAGVIKDGAQPGWALLAKKDGPCALVLKEGFGADA